jgi:hypothetical protein
MGFLTMLDDRIRSRILGDHTKLIAEGKLYSRSQLDGFYRNSRCRFVPEELARLDDEELLEAMHALGTKDSLVYWLEFKNDDEFPGHLGSIAGGSAFKFGIFRSKETGSWVTGSPTDVKELTAPRAVEIARKHRDDLVKGVDRIGALSDLAPDTDYRKLQEDIGQVAPSVSDLAWGHKYFSLLARHLERVNERLDELLGIRKCEACRTEIKAPKGTLPKNERLWCPKCLALRKSASICKRIHTFRWASMLSPQSLSELTRIGIDKMQFYEYDEAKPPQDDLARLIAVLGEELVSNYPGYSGGDPNRGVAEG